MATKKLAPTSPNSNTPPAEAGTAKKVAKPRVSKEKASIANDALTTDNHEAATNDTEGIVPYEPDFTHSVLDAKPVEPSAPTKPTLRYSDSELNEFKELILRKLDAAKKELSYLQGVITRKDSMGSDGEDGRYMTLEDGSLSMEREQLSQMASRQITFIDHLEKALMRIESKTYGVCRVTGKLIDKARLRAVPHATLSMDAKLGKVRVG
jgi:RNA polymerase-binding transcription factor DksA